MGDAMVREIAEQGDRVADALAGSASAEDQLATMLDAAKFVVLIGRGSSRAVCSYGAWALQRATGRPAVVISPVSLVNDADGLDLVGALVVAVSQSGESREVVAAAGRAQRRGAVVLAVTNAGDSPLAMQANAVMRCHAGREQAVPATKSVTTAMACLLALAHAGDPEALERATVGLPALMRRVLDGGGLVDLSGSRSVVLVGEGAGAAIAEEGAIKIREILRLPVTALETSEFLHGSINAVGTGTAVVALTLDATTVRLADQVIAGCAERGAVTWTIGASAGAGPNRQVVLPATDPEWVAFGALIVLQRSAWAAGLSAGGHPDRPQGLQKVTLLNDFG